MIRRSGLFAILIAGLCTGAAAETVPLRYSCASVGAKTVLPRGLCELFGARLARAVAPRAVRRADPSRAGITFVVTDTSEHSLAVRIDRGLDSGPELGIARQDAALGSTDRTGLIDALIADLLAH